MVSGPRAALTSARLDLVTGTDSVTVTSADLGNVLFRAATPAHARQVPRETSSGDAVTVSLADVSGPGPAQVDVVLNSRVSWAVSLDGAASAERVDLSGAHLSALTFAAGSASIDVQLPAPVGDVPVVMRGGASDFVVRTPAGVPYQVLFAGGAGSATIDGAVRSGVAGGTAISSPNWDTAANRYTIDNSAGVSAFTLAAR
ncbi:MAG: hypothetical protein ACJ786_16680 [Catenulispora sp.]